MFLQLRVLLEAMARGFDSEKYSDANSSSQTLGNKYHSGVDKETAAMQ